MLGGVKFIPRDQIAKDDSSDALKKERKKSGRKEEKHRRKKRSLRYSSSDEELEKVKRASRKKKWYSSDEYSSSSYSSENEGGESSSEDEKSGRKRRKGKKSYEDSSGDEASDRSKRKGNKKDRRKMEKKGSGGDIAEHDISDDSRGPEIVRKEIGLEWMLRPDVKMDRGHEVTIQNEPEVDAKSEEKEKVNPRELNPYLKDNGSGYPVDNDEPKAGGSELLPSSLVGDGGASWRLKALKRAREQAVRDGRKVDEVVEERWGSLGQLAVSVASHKAAPSHAHLHAIRSRQRGLIDEGNRDSANQHGRDIEKNTSRDYLKDVSLKQPTMREPKVQDSLSWGKRRSQNVSTHNAGLISDAMSSINKFANDGSFMHKVIQKHSNNSSIPVTENVKPETETSSMVKEPLSANQLAAKALQLRMKGKHEEAEKLMQEVENMKAKQDGGDNLVRSRKEESSSRYVIQDMSLRRKKNEDDADMHLAQKIMQNKKFSTSGQADDEYDFDDGPRRKSQKKRGGNDKAQKNIIVNRFSNQQERCIFCLENPRRPKHLVVAIGNFTYLMLPQQEPVVPGHCCILTLQHVPSTISVDDNVWEEIRNFKKCLIMMFAEQDKDVVFLETVIGLAQQRRHCLVECIPLPRETDEDPVNYFKKAIRDAEDDWAVAKNVDTGPKGLRGKIPKNIPYFHVEFGLKKGFLHQIDDEEQFRNGFGLNVIRGILELPEEDMYRRRRQRSESVSDQIQAVKNFSRDWEPFDWTKQLHQE
ncbi:Cwf19-like protein [Trema orientale]|uniref:Cwf19-like protein n=1 Tax=Trema orientale TaxID=63057 RepID=A0A2P5ECS3_TREOI|nr:Cwf19-like protein [Trema orientale]